ncbi:MAG: LD-carboxypeptidase [Ruminococcaceae bacterium]|nr:LD-carboxypeptidase [Oscillospiraceae bacterium]
MLKPKPLFPGARVALVAPAGPVPPERYGPAVRALEELELRPVVFESCRRSHGYFAGSDELRARDMNAAFADPEIDGIFCIRGGYGAQRLMGMLDYDVIRRNPKFFAGYSDVTALHIAFNQKCGFITYHTPMPSTELYAGVDDFTMASLKKALFGEPFGALRNPENLPLTTLVGGCACGTLTGGNLSLVASSLGTPYEIDTRDKILFLEDVEEEPYRVDRMLLQLKAAGKFRDCAGILLGWWTDCTAEHPEKSLTLRQVFQELLVDEHKPALMDLACGHSLPTLSLPLGSKLEMNSISGKITVLD